MQDTGPHYFKGMEAMGTSSSLIRIKQSNQNSADLYPDKVVACTAAMDMVEKKGFTLKNKNKNGAVVLPITIGRRLLSHSHLKFLLCHCFS